MSQPPLVWLHSRHADARATLEEFETRFGEVFSSDEVKKLQTKGVRLQRPLWASTGTKNKAYSDVLYVESLIGKDTINSVPPETLDAFRDHGHAKVTLLEGQSEAEEVIGRLQAMEINMRSVGMELTEEGVEKFEKSYDDLLASLDRKRVTLKGKSAA